MLAPRLLFAAVLVFLASSGMVDAGYTAGCSFFGDQCVYSVSLGSQCQPSGSGSGLTTAACCDALKVDVSSVGFDNNLPDTQVVSLLGGGVIDQSQVASDQVKAERDALQAELAVVKSELVNMTSQVDTCRAALGLPDVVSLSSGGPISLRYCNFEDESNCTWSYDTAVVFYMSGTSSSSGPTSDHSFGSYGGRYLALDASDVAGYHKTSATRSYTITGEDFEPANDYCIFFYYSMVGEDVEGLEVSIETDTGFSYPVWSTQGKKISEWLMGQFELDREYTRKPFRLRFKASSTAYNDYYGRKQQYNGDIAIDDVYGYNATCKEVLQCPSHGFQRNNSDQSISCYTFHAQSLSWEEAYRTCRMEGPTSALVSVESEEEQNFLVSVINSDPALTSTGQFGFYTSGSDRKYEGSFSWTNTGSSRPVSGLYENWGYRQPNNVGGVQDCLLLEEPDENFAWGDVNCETAHPFICERVLTG